MQPVSIKGRRGRPPKFREPRRPITVTLPERTLAKLASIHPDRAQALALAVDRVSGHVPEPPPPVEVVEAAKGIGVILVGPSKALHRVRALTLVEVSRDRFLLALAPGSTTDTLEVGLMDVVEDLKPSEAAERPMLESLREQIARLRRTHRVQRAEILFVNL